MQQRFPTQASQYAETIDQIIDVRFSKENYYLQMMSTLDEALTQSEVSALLNWYNTALGTMILQAEAYSNDPANAAEVARYIETQLINRSARTARLALTEELMEAMDATALSEELAQGAHAGAMRMFKELFPVGWNATLAPKRNPASATEEQLQNQMRYLFLYTYRHLSDTQLQSYVEFAQQSAMRNFQRAQVQAIVMLL